MKQLNRRCDDCGALIVGHGNADDAHYCYDCGRSRIAYRDALGFDVAASWEDIAAELGVTRQRVKQIYDAILVKLKRRYGIELRAVLAEIMEQDLGKPDLMGWRGRFTKQEEL